MGDICISKGKDGFEFSYPFTEYEDQVGGIVRSVQRMKDVACGKHREVPLTVVVDSLKRYSDCLRELASVNDKICYDVDNMLSSSRSEATKRRIVRGDVRGKRRRISLREANVVMMR